MQFDEYAANYQADIDDITGVSAEKLAGEKARLIIEILNKWVDDPKRLRVLDIGCGIGLVERNLETEVGDVCGVDTSLQSLEFARTQAPRTRFVHYEGETLPVADASFDAAFVSNVLHHIPLAARSKFLTEMVRAIRPGGPRSLLSTIHSIRLHNTSSRVVSSMLTLCCLSFVRRPIS